MDWNEDGRKDLLTGESSGHVRIYINSNTDADPQFSGYQLLLKGVNAFDAGTRSVPFVVDWNNDGKKDVLCGETGGKVFLMINVGTNAKPIFLNSSYIQDGAADLDMGEESSPWAADWNRDGKKDLIIGDDYGKIYYYENVGTDAAPLFDGYTWMEAGGLLLTVNDDSRPCVVDWDNDGVLDLLVGDDGYGASIDAGVLYFHSRGPLVVDNCTLSATTGGTVNFSLDAGAANGLRHYFLMGTGSGTEPGTSLPGGAILPLNWSQISWYIFNNHNSKPLSNFRGQFDSSGKALATLTVVSPPLPVGLILNFAYTTEWPYDYQSNPVSVEIVP